MLFNTKFDLVVSIGEDCACSGYLRRCKLQDYSYPFDWLTKAPFINRLDLILNDFSDFLLKEELYLLDMPQTEHNGRKIDCWADKKNDLYFYHDFFADEPCETVYLKVKEKYERRIKRFYKQIANSKKILFVWWSRDKHQDINVVKDYYIKLCQKFSSKSIYLLLVEYSENEENVFLENNHILISRFDNISYKHNKHWNETMGNEANNFKIFSQIKMNRTRSWQLKYSIYCLFKIFVEIIPIKNIRINLRQKLKSIFYKEAL